MVALSNCRAQTMTTSHTTKYHTDRTDREPAAGKAQRYNTIPKINLYTACHALMTN